MSALELVNHLRSQGVRLWAEGEKLRCNAPKGVLTADVRARLATHKAEVLSLLRSPAGAGPRPPTAPIEAAERDGDIPLSYSQQALWFLKQLAPDNVSYNILSGVRIEGPLHIPGLEQSLDELVRRHEILRTTFELRGTRTVQVIAPGHKSWLAVIDLEGFPAAAAEAEARRLAELETRWSFDLGRGPLLRGLVMRFHSRDHVLVFNMHHIVADGWSSTILVREMLSLYASIVAGRPSPLAELPIQYADYAIWQRKWLTADALEDHLEYWRRHLQGCPAMLELPTDRPRPAVESHWGRRHEVGIPPETGTGLVRLSRRERVTVFMTVLAVFKVLLYRLTGQEDLVVGSPTANRSRPETEGLIGFFVNTIVLRTKPSGRQAFREFLAQVRRVCLEAYAHQDVPFEKLVEELRIERTLSHNPLYQALITFNTPGVETLDSAGLKLMPWRIPADVSKVDMAIAVREHEGVPVSTEFECNADLFERTTIQRFVSAFLHLLREVTAGAERHLAELGVLAPAQRHQLLAEWNGASVARSPARCFPQVFEQKAGRSPEAVAVIFEDVQVTYGQLDRQARRMARQVTGSGVRAQEIVAVMAERSVDLLVSILALFKIGAVYLPLDPRHPRVRWFQVLEQSGAAMVMVDRACAGMLEATLPGARDGSRPRLNRIGASHDPLPSQEYTTPDCGPEWAAYTIYTSGSTGAPKGAVVTHQGLINHLDAKIRDLRLGASDVVAQTASQCFDISLWQLLAALLVGARVRIFADEVAHDPTRLFEAVDASATTVWETVPSLLRAVLDQATNREIHPSGLRWMISTGEALESDLCRRWSTLYPKVAMVNAYGPTECSDDVTHHLVHGTLHGGARRPPVGRPILNTQIYVLDRDVQPTCVEVRGEIYVGGIGVGRGYLGRPDLTAAAFLPDPFSATPGTRLYRTGDLGRWLVEGSVELSGRLGHQVKIRGRRIELGEIETVLGQHPAVAETVVVAFDDESTGKDLVAYVVCAGGPGEGQVVWDGRPPDAAELRAYLKDRLPEYMVPPRILILELMPLTPNGKIDRNALPAPEAANSPETFAAPRTPVEQILAETWAEVLRKQTVGIHNNFFELGGHSLAVTQVVSRLRELFQIELPFRLVFERPTVAELAAAILQEPDQAARVLRTAELLTSVQDMSEEELDALLDGV